MFATSELRDPVSAMIHRLKAYAEEARITKDFTSEDLRRRLTELQVRLAVFEPETAAQADRMTFYYALNFALERSIRKLVYETLKKKYAEKWSEKIPLDVHKEITRRQAEDRGSPKVVRSILQPLDYTTFPELRKTIEANWDDFTNLFPDVRVEDLSYALRDLGDCRILIAHSCELPEEEKARFELRFGDWFRMLVSKG